MTPREAAREYYAATRWQMIQARMGMPDDYPGAATLDRMIRLLDRARRAETLDPRPRDLLPAESAE